MINLTTQRKSKEKIIEKTEQKFKPQIRWLDLIAILYVHVGALYGLYLLLVSRDIRNFLWSKYYQVACMKFFQMSNGINTIPDFH